MDGPNPVDEALDRVAAGDRGAFKTLYDATAPKLFALALRITGDRPLAEDAVQNAFVDIWKTSRDFDARRGRAEAWMVGVVRHRAIDLVRARGARPAPAAAMDAAEIERSDGTSAEETYVDRMALDRCLEDLEDGGARMVRDAYLEGLSREELSRRFDMPVNTVKTRLRRALARLRTCLEGET